MNPPIFRLQCELDFCTWGLPVCLAWQFSAKYDWIVLQILCIRFIAEFGDLDKPRVWVG